jgi:hypothetical protein
MERIEDIDYLKLDTNNESGWGVNRISAVIPARAVIQHNLDTSDMVKITDRSVYPENFLSETFDYRYIDGQFVHDPLPRTDIPVKDHPPFWYHLADNPSQGMGSSGDYCLNTTTGVIFHKMFNKANEVAWETIYTPPKIIQFVNVFGPSNSSVHQDSRFIRFPVKLVGGTKIIQVTPATEPEQKYNDGFSPTIGEITDEGFWVEVCRTDKTEPWGQNLHLHVTVTHQP